MSTGGHRPRPVGALLKAASALVTAALIGAAMWLTNLDPHVEDKMMNPIDARGRIGQVVGNPVFSAQVRRVDVASGIVHKDALAGDRVMPSLGVFVIVYLRIRSNRKPFEPGHVRLSAAGGRSYDESGRIGIDTATKTYEPMTWDTATFVFEIPKDALAGARLIVGEATLTDSLTAQADVDLGIDRAGAARLLAHPPSNYALASS